LCLLKAKVIFYTIVVYTSSKIFDGAGLLAIDEVYFGEKLVIDYEVVSRHTCNVALIGIY